MKENLIGLPIRVNISGMFFFFFVYSQSVQQNKNLVIFHRVIYDHKVNGLLTAPTALRVIKREDPEVSIGRRYSTKSLRTLFVAGEHCDNESIQWAQKAFNVSFPYDIFSIQKLEILFVNITPPLQAPILNHWWQTETGHAITASCIGLEHSNSPPRHSAGMAFPGYDGKCSHANECEQLTMWKIHFLILQ